MISGWFFQKEIREVVISTRKFKTYDTREYFYVWALGYCGQNIHTSFIDTDISARNVKHQSIKKSIKVFLYSWYDKSPAAILLSENIVSN